MLRPFSFLNTTPETPEGRNWRTLDENTKTFVSNTLTMVSPTSDPVINYGYFTRYGPLVHYNIKMTLDSDDGWTTSSYIILPFPEFIASGAQQAAHQGQAYVGLTGASITAIVFGSVTNSDRLAFAGAYTNSTGADQVVFLQGWYLRN